MIPLRNQLTRPHTADQYEQIAVLKRSECLHELVYPAVSLTDCADLPRGPRAVAYPEAWTGSASTGTCSPP